MSYWTKRRKFNSSVAKQIADLSTNTSTNVETDTLPDIHVDLSSVGILDDVAANGGNVREEFVVNECTVRDDWLDNDDDDYISSGDECDSGSPGDTDAVDIVDQLRTWAIAGSVKQDVLSQLLVILQSRIPELPKDAPLGKQKSQPVIAVVWHEGLVVEMLKMSQVLI